MPALTLPTFTRAEVETHNTEKSCYVTIDDAIYDITDFVESHPGGPELVLEYAGKDIKAILRDPVSHTHSESAYEILEETLVGFVSEKASMNGSVKASNGSAQTANGSADFPNTFVHPRTGMSCEEDLSKETDYNSDYKKHKFLDLSRPLFPQIWFGGFSKEFYLDQVHRPRHYKGGASAPLFGNFLEPLSKTPWWVVPAIWGPCVAYGTYLASAGYSNVPEQALYWALGFGLWSLIEYILHRFLFHLDEYVPPLSITSRNMLTSCSDGFPTTVLASPCTSSSTASTTICPWTSTAWSCRPFSSSSWQPRSGSWPMPSSPTGTRRRQFTAAVSLATFATT